MEILGAVLHAVSLARSGARVAGHPVPGLEEAHSALAPVRARQNAEQAQEMGQSINGTAPPDPGAEAVDDGAADVEAPEVADSGGVLEFLGDAVGWIADQF